MNRYLRRDFFQVDGYTSFFDARLFDYFLAVQTAAGIGGSMAEIGVHHGRSFFLLAQARGEGEHALAIDVFEDDALYQDPLGLGRGARFHRNCDRLGVRLNGDEIFVGPSRGLDPAEIRRRVGQVRFFSIDGGHRYDDVIHDMRLAAAALHPRGIIVADDYMNPQWPEVSLALADWLREPGNTLSPFLSSSSKLYLCARSERPIYRGYAKQFLAHGRYQVRETALFSDAYFFSRQSLRGKARDFLKERLLAKLPRRHGALPA